MLYQATEADLPAIRAFLAPRLATSMFLSGNLRDQGLGGSHPRGMTLWFSKGKSGITNVIGCANSGYLVCEAPGLTEDLFASLRDRLARRALRGVNGVAAQISGVLRALELPMPCAVMDAVEPHYRLDLAQLLVPGGQSTLRRAEPEDLQLLTDWRMASEVEVLGGSDTPQNRAQARASLQELQQADRLRVLMAEGVPVAMTNFNAVLPGIVQIGGVYTPPGLRGCGYARRAVALHLQDARDSGTSEAILFAASPAAARAYEAIGFGRIGDYRIVNFDPPVTVEDGLRKRAEGEGR